MKLYGMDPIYVLIIATIVLLVATFFNTITYADQVTEEFYYRRRSKAGRFFKKIGGGIKKGATTVAGGVKKGATTVAGDVKNIATITKKSATTVASGVKKGATTVASGVKKGATTVASGVKKGAIKVGGAIKTVSSKITKKKEEETKFDNVDVPALQKKTYSGPEGSLIEDESELYKSPVALKSTGKASSPEFNFDSLSSHNKSCSAAMSRCNSPYCLTDGTLMTCANEYITYMTKTNGLIPTYEEGDWDGFQF